VQAVISVCFNPDGRTVTGDSNGDILLWSLPAPTYSVQQAISNAHPGGVFALAATPDGLVSGGGKDYRVRLFDWDMTVWSLSKSFGLLRPTRCLRSQLARFLTLSLAAVSR
jgi:WD40 repeat protein